MSTPLREVYQLDPGAQLVLVVLDTAVLGGTLYRFHAGTNQLGGAVVWQGQTYQPWPVKIDGLEWTGKGAQPRPTIAVANLDISSTMQESTIGGLVRQYQDLVGAKVIIKRVWAKHLDAVNFPGGVNPTADPSEYFPDEVFEVEQKASETAQAVVFQLACSLDAQGLRLPARVIQATVCGWKNSDTDICPHVTNCDRRMVTCKTFFGANNPLPFGGFEGANRLRG
jgi:lambda family phage minor tail protein L